MINVWRENGQSVLPTTRNLIDAKRNTKHAHAQNITAPPRSFIAVVDIPSSFALLVVLLALVIHHRHSPDTLVILKVAKLHQNESRFVSTVNSGCRAHCACLYSIFSCIFTHKNTHSILFLATMITTFPSFLLKAVYIRWNMPLRLPTVD